MRGNMVSWKASLCQLWNHVLCAWAQSLACSAHRVWVPPALSLTAKVLLRFMIQRRLTKMHRAGAALLCPHILSSCEVLPCPFVQCPPDQPPPCSQAPPRHTDRALPSESLPPLSQLTVTLPILYWQVSCLQQTKGSLGSLYMCFLMYLLLVSQNWA